MKKINSLFIFAIIAIFLIIFGSTAPVNYIRGKIQAVASPITRLAYRSSNSSFKTISILSQIRNLAKDNTHLRQENTQLKAQVDTLKEARSIDKDLEKQYALTGNNIEQKLMGAKVIGRSPSIQRDILIINKGSDMGVKKGQPVLSNGFLIGKISQVTTDNSQIELITSAHFMIPVILQDSRQTGLLTGGLKGLVIGQLANDVNIKNGESVVTSGLANELPQGLPIGTVGQTISKSSDIFKTVTMVSPVDTSSVETVFIMEAK